MNWSTDRQTDRQTDRETERERDRQTDRETDRHRQTDRQTELTLSYSQLDVEVNWSTDDGLGHDKNILETNDDNQIRKYLTTNSNEHNSSILNTT